MSFRMLSARAEPDWDACEAVARHHGRSFHFASRMLPGDRRRAILAAYAYCRLADDIVDRPSVEREAIEAELYAWEREIDRPRHPVAVAFAEARARYGIPDQPVHDLFRGLHADRTVDEYETWEDLRGYCHYVAGTVGLIVAPILGCQDDSMLPRAAELGIAMQLTNILRDVGEDAAMGRVYLPAEDMDRFGISREDVLRRRSNDRFAMLIRFEIDRAHVLYRNALTAVPALCWSGRLTTLAAARLYAGILDQIETNPYDVMYRRAVVPRNRKARCTAAAIGEFISYSTPRRQSRRPAEIVPGTPGYDTEGWLA
ncbi:MAG: phytoene/squalene synthase family protein [Thermomicrobiales bacterium]|nr:phytoene/squalene synthase family protein [Thermomicrobiales bacterium]